MTRLKDKRPEVRLEAIQELALLEATEALEALREIYETDPEETIRRAAQESGRKIFLRAQARQRAAETESEQ